MPINENILYKKLLTKEILKTGWHLYRRDRRQNFIEDVYAIDTLSVELEETVKEIQKRLLNGDYQARNLLRTEIPKKGLGVRPGATMTAEDSIVMNAILFLLVFPLNKELSSSVYSFRLKKEIAESGKYINGKDLFEETYATDIPFLRKSTIYKKYMYYDDWYITWIEFDKKAKETAKRYRFMATSDIAAYFENIQLPILKSQIQKVLKDEPKLINLLFDFLLNWTERTYDGEILSRGLPQGSSVFSFLGNYYLKPIDDYFDNHHKKDEFEYFRYMDDIKIFTNDINLAKKLLLELNRELRKLHLNTQSAKTEIFDEENHEISKEIIDPRIEKLTALDINKKNIDKMSSKEKNELIQQVEAIISENPINGVAIKGHKKPLKGLDERLFLRYITASCALENAKFINSYFKELHLNFEQKLLKKLPIITEVFSKHTSLEKKIIGFMNSKDLIIPYQKAICIKSLRYLASLRKDTEDLVYEYLIDTDENFYVRYEAAMLLSTVQLDMKKIQRIKSLWEDEKNIFLQSVLSFILTQRLDKPLLMRQLILFPNYELHKIHILFYKLRNDFDFIKGKIDFYMKNENIVDHISLINVVASSDSKEILLFLKGKLTNKKLYNIPNTRIRNYLKNIKININQKLNSIPASS